MSLLMPQNFHIFFSYLLLKAYMEEDKKLVWSLLHSWLSLWGLTFNVLFEIQFIFESNDS